MYLLFFAFCLQSYDEGRRPPRRRSYAADVLLVFIADNNIVNLRFVLS